MIESIWEKPNSGEIEKRRCEVEKNKRGEEDRPHKQNMYKNVDWIAVVCTIEGKVTLKIKQSRLPHWNFGKKIIDYKEGKKKSVIRRRKSWA